MPSWLESIRVGTDSSGMEAPIQAMDRQLGNDVYAPLHCDVYKCAHATSEDIQAMKMQAMRCVPTCFRVAVIFIFM